MASIVLSSNLNAAKLQFELPLSGAQTPGVVVNPLLTFDPHDPQAAC
jgi:hypothetical protein